MNRRQRSKERKGNSKAVHKGNTPPKLVPVASEFALPMVTAEPPKIGPWVKMQIDTRPESGTAALLSEAELVFDALSSYRDDLLKELGEMADAYEALGTSRAGIIEDFRTGDVAIALAHVKMLNTQIDALSVELAIDLRRFHKATRK